MVRAYFPGAAGLAAGFVGLWVTLLPAGAEGVSPHFVSVKNIDPNHLITVQIDPAEQAKSAAKSAAKPAAGANSGSGAIAPVKPAALPPVDGNAQQAALRQGGFATGSDVVPRYPSPFARTGKGLPIYNWYWNLVPTGLFGGAGRFQLALAALSEGPAGRKIAAPGLRTMQDLASTWGGDIEKDTARTQVSPALVLAVMAVESGGDAAALSQAGAQGLMQLIPATARRFGVSDPMKGAESIRGAVAYLDWLMKRFNGDPVMVLAAYNAGEGAVRASSGVPLFRETRDYVPKVLAAWKVARTLCVTPPAFVSDPCKFKLLSAQK